MPGVRTIRKYLVGGESATEAMAPLGGKVTVRLLKVGPIHKVFIIEIGQGCKIKMRIKCVRCVRTTSVLVDGNSDGCARRRRWLYSPRNREDAKGLALVFALLFGMCGLLAATSRLGTSTYTNIAVGTSRQKSLI